MSLMRVMIRFSVDNEPNSDLRKKLEKVLDHDGFVRERNTATYERADVDASEIAEILEEFWSAAAVHVGPGRIDHFWLYSDR
jgi:hypothetical protein